MKKERNATSKTLYKENRKIILKIEHFLETRGINDIAGEEIISDIVGMALECQERGDSFSDMIGDDHEAFCKELIKNAPRQKLHEKILRIIQWFLLFAMLLMPSLYLIELVFPQYSPAEVEGLLYSGRLSFVMKHYLILTVLTFGTFFVRMYTYKPTKYVIGTYLAVVMTLFMFTDSVLDLIVGRRLFNVNVLLWVVCICALLIMCYLTRRIVAMSVAYKQRNKMQ